MTRAGTINYLQVSAELGIVVVPVSLLMIAGEFDLSIGAMVGAAGIAVAYPLSVGWPLIAAIACALAVAVLVGLFNGLLVVRTGLPSFIVTLATLYILRGVTIAVTNLLAHSTIVTGINKNGWFASLFAGTWHQIPASVFWWIGLTLIAGYVLARTAFGNWIYGTGGGTVAARNVGVSTRTVKVVLFVATACGATLLATIQVLQIGSADVSNGTGLEFQAVAASVIGGTLLTGGYGSALGAAIGALLFGMVSQGIFFTGIDYNWFQAVLGGMLLAAVLINHYIRLGRRTEG